MEQHDIRFGQPPAITREAAGSLAVELEEVGHPSEERAVEQDQRAGAKRHVPNLTKVQNADASDCLRLPSAQASLAAVEQQHADNDDAIYHLAAELLHLHDREDGLEESDQDDAGYS